MKVCNIWILMKCHSTVWPSHTIGFTVKLISSLNVTNARSYCWKILLRKKKASFKLHVFYCVWSLSDYSLSRQSNIAYHHVIWYSGQDTFKHCKIYFVLQTQCWENSPQNHQTLHSRYSWEGTESWWVMQTHQSRECSLRVCLFLCLFVLPTTFHSFSSVSLNGKQCRLIWKLLISWWHCTPLHLICTPTSRFKMSFCTVPKPTWQVINEGSRGRCGSIPSPIHPASLTEAIFYWGSPLTTQVIGSFEKPFEKWKKHKKSES